MAGEAFAEGRPLPFQDNEIAVGRIGKKLPQVGMLAIFADLIGPHDLTVLVMRVDHDVIGIVRHPRLVVVDCPQVIAVVFDRAKCVNRG